MKYLVLIYGDEKAATTMTEADMQKEMAAYGEYTAKLAAARATSGGAALHPTHTATTVRVRNGKIATADGPFAETKEQLGGYYIIEAANLDEAVKWGAQCPGAKNGCVEVRPIAIMSDATGKVEFLQ
jgi:hypothetical protein